MQAQPLPRQVDARKLTTAEAAVDAVEAVSSFPRYAAELSDDAGEVAVKLLFFRDEQGGHRISGTLSTRVQVTCQRCLQAMPLPVESAFELGVVWNDAQARALPAALEALIVGEEPLDLVVLVEDELILGTPFINYHDVDQCPVRTPVVFEDPADPQDDKAQGEPNPFAVLEKLKPGDQ